MTICSRSQNSYLMLLLLIGVCLGHMSCNTDVPQKMKAKPTALGKMNEIVVIADEDIWEGPVGDTFRFYFESAYPILPAPEPLFDLRHFTPNDLKVQSIRKELRTYVVLADVSNADSPTAQIIRADVGDEKIDYPKDGKVKFTSVGKDKWARGQLLAYMYAKGEDNLSQTIMENFPAIAKRVNLHDSKQFRAGLYVERINKGLTTELLTDFGLDLPIPADFETAISDKENKVLWLRKNTKKADLNLIIKTLPYSDKSQLSKSNILAMRDDFGATYVTADSKTDVMAVDSVHLPVHAYSCSIDGKYGREFRGIWAMTESFAGGPFASYVIVNDERGELIFVDAFILGPGAKKRDLMMQLDHMVKSAKVG